MAHRLQCSLRSHEAIVGYLEAVRRDQQPRTQVPAIRHGRADAVIEAA
ncbi:hypothetical protein [Streptomyces sp. AM 2-1-1]|nr:hypothetical protein [Streptomyces sp. AM 2-1-1]WEH43455.1 hypothetical protein PZB77_30390 [Streptomyces sp. AM 2-1-1]